MIRSLRLATTGLLLLAVGLAGGCGSRAAESGRGSARPMSACQVARCAKLSLAAIARDLGEPRLVHTAAVPSALHMPALPVCGLKPAGTRRPGSVIALVLGFRVSDTAFRKQVQYFQSDRFSSVVRTLPYGDIIYVNVINSRDPLQELVFFTQGQEYDVMVGDRVNAPFTQAQLLEVARLLARV